MKKRIISLILVVVMSLLTLSGCAYSYEKDDMKNYASFNSAKFLAAIQALDIEEGTFGTDEETRWVKVQDAIISAIASKAADKTNKINEGKVGAYDILYYSYFYTITVGEGENEKTLYFDTNKMTEASSNVQFGLSANEEGKLSGELQQAFADKFEFVKDNSETADNNEANYYVTSKTGKVEPKENKFLGVNVTYKVADKDAEGNLTTAVKHTNETVFVPFVAEGAEVNTFVKYLYGKSIGAIEDFTVEKGDGKSLVYSEITINFTLNWADGNDDGNDFAPIVIGDDEGEEIKYEKKSSDKDETKVTDSYGNTATAGELNGKTMVYYIFPVYFVDVEENLTVETLLYKIFGENLSSTSLEIFGTESEYKNGEDKISALVDALKTKIKEYNTAEKAQTTADTTYNTKLSALKNAIANADQKTKFDGLVKAALDAFEAQRTATSENTEAAKAYKTAYEALTNYLDGTDHGVTDASKKTEFKSAYDAKIKAIEKFDAADKARTEAKDKVLGCLENKEEMAEKILESYRESQYDSLEAAYRSEITDAVADEIIHLAQECITYNGKYPKKALKEAIERVENELKYNFYTGTYSGTDTSLKGKTNYVAFGGSFDKYVISVSDLGLNAESTKADIDAAIKAKAEAAIRDVILVYTLVDCLNSLDGVEIALTKEEKKNIKTQVNNYSNVRESDFKVAYMLDKVFDYFMELEDRGEEPAKVEKPAEGTSAEYDAYLAAMEKYNAVNFKHVKIAEDAE